MHGAWIMKRDKDFAGCRGADRTLSWPAMPGLRLLRLLMVVALIFAPLAMIGGHAAMAAPATSAAGEHHASELGGGHCSDMGEEESGDPRASIDCMVACAGMLPSTPAFATAPLLLKSPNRPIITVAQHGLNPAAEPRPPRLS
jgi:hypothetical protein